MSLLRSLFHFLSLFFFLEHEVFLFIEINPWKRFGPEMGTIIRAKVRYPNESRVFEKRLRGIGGEN